MFRAIEDESEIKRHQLQFETALKSFVDDKVLVTIGHLGETLKKEVYWSSKLGIWMVFEKLPRSRYWNAFGIGKPNANSLVPIISEINFPLSDIDKRIAGAFAIDNARNVIVVHSGKIGGGRRGIGKKLFEENYRGEWTNVVYGQSERAVALIGALKESKFAWQVREFVFEVERIKAHPLSPLKESPHEFHEEFSGEKRYTGGKNIIADCDHGLVVNRLARELQARKFNVGNDRNRDLYVVSSDSRVTCVFEVKTDASRSSLYSAVGQLLLNRDRTSKQKLVLVVPEQISASLEDNLVGIGISLLVFHWRGDQVDFDGLDKLGL